MAILVKVCGLTCPADAREAIRFGADYGGVIGYEDSPRHVPLDQTAPLLAEIPPGRRVRVGVETCDRELEAAFRAGFDLVQVHFDPQGSFDPAAVSERFGADRLWLAPRLANPLDFAEEWIGLAAVVLVDGFSADRFGGTGKRVAGAAFAELCARHPGQVFAVAGGIAPANVEEVLRATGSGRIDVNSGVEKSPGIKDPALLRDLLRRVRSLA